MLRAWKSKFGLDATYKCLLEILAKVNHTEGAKAVCRVLKRRGKITGFFCSDYYPVLLCFSCQ